MMADLLTEMSGDDGSGMGGSGAGSGLGIEIGSGDEGEAEDEEELLEYVEVPKDYYLIAYMMRLMAAVHSIISLAMLVAYYHLKVIQHEISFLL